MTSGFRRSPLALAILGLLEAGPLHPYGIQQLIKQWGKDEVINVGQRASLYKIINRLNEAGLIEVRSSSRDEQYPERTAYDVTASGKAAVRQWLAEILSTHRNEFPEFPAALSFLQVISPSTSADLLEQRLEQLIQRVAELDAEIVIQIEGFHLPRITMLETEYVRAVTVAEMEWVRSILPSLRDGALTWTHERT